MKSQIKKLIPYGFILVIVFGFFGFFNQVSASTNGGRCFVVEVISGTPEIRIAPEDWTKAKCDQWKIDYTSSDWLTDQEIADGKKPNLLGNTTTYTPASTTPGATGSAFLDEISKASCGIGGWFWDNGSSLGGCAVQIAYYIFYVLPAFLLWLAALFFNALLSITLLDTSIYTASTFIPAAWAVVRDLSNIFFIIVLLYVAIQTILGIGGGGHGGGPKKVIAQVVVMALLINFSMFFTKVVIDSANILALVFYNKISVTTKVGGATRQYTPSTNNAGEKDLAGGMVENFDPTRLMSADFFKKAGEQVIPATPTKPAQIISGKVPIGTLLGIILLTGAIMLFAAYAFFIAGLAFLGRMVELWVLIIFSPFAFMSSTISFLDHVPSIGWKEWLHRLLASAFMAPIFMFFMYFIFKMVAANPYGNFINGGSGMIATILLILIPALVILTLLMKATDYAKKGAGKFGEMAIKGGQMVAGLAGAAALGGAGMALRGTAGLAGSAMANSTWAKRLETKGANNQFTKWISKTTGGRSDKAIEKITRFAGARLRDVGAATGKASFDARGLKVAGVSLESATGFKLGSAQSGGYDEARKKKVAKRQLRAKGLEVSEDEGVKQELNRVERDLQELLAVGAHEITQIDNQIKGTLLRQKSAAAVLDTMAKTGTTSKQLLKDGKDKDGKKITKDSEEYKQALKKEQFAQGLAERVDSLRAVRSRIKNATGSDSNMKAYKADLEKAQAELAQLKIDAEKDPSKRGELDDKRNDVHALQTIIDVAKASANIQERNGGKFTSINEHEDFIIPAKHHKIEELNQERKRAEADRVGRKWGRANREASQNIRMGAAIKMPKGGGGGHAPEASHDSGHDSSGDSSGGHDSSGGASDH